jgi:hypothetical protein
LKVTLVSHRLATSIMITQTGIRGVNLWLPLRPVLIT